MKTEKIGAGEFKTHCLKLLDEVNQKHVELVITKRGKPLARLIPFSSEIPSLFGAMKNTVILNGDIVEPTGEQWEVDSDE